MKAPKPQNILKDSEHDDAHDPVWNLLRQSPTKSASPDFADRVIRTARLLDQQPSPFWARSYSAFAAIAGVAAALVIAAVVIFLPEPAATVVEHKPDAVDAFAPLDEVANQEMLLAATDHLGEFSDTELVSLIGF